MGCNDSKSLKRAMSPSGFSKTHKSSTNDSYSRPRDRKDQNFQQNRFGKASRMTPFYQELEDMHQKCNRDFKKFIMTIEERVSQIYMEISREILSDMNHDEIAAEQSKIIISEEILSLNLNILKVIGRNRNFQYDKETFKSLNKFQNNLVGYLKTKYPRGQQTFVSGDLMNHFKEFDRVNDLEYDILKNSNTYFGEPEQQKIVKGIKLFINKLMKECDTFFPEFEKLMQDRAFFIKNQKGQKVSLNYKIGRKIPQNVPKYQKFDTQVLEVTSPQIFRVLIKWMEDLEQTIMKTSQKISKKQSFKCYVGERPSNEPNIQADKNEKQLLFDYINEYQYSQIVNKLVPKIQDLKPKLEKKNQQFIDQLDQFNQRLLKILNQADPRQKYVPTKQIQTIKYSSFNAKFVEFILTQKLVYTIKQLIRVGQFFISQYMMNLDIIKFRVTDLMRCQVSGNKKEVLQVYKNFQKLEQEGKIQIIKIKNRLSTPLNDAMIIFAIKDCWVICQAQLILTDGGDKADKKSKNTQLVNHYFYELQRSPYGIMAEIAVLLTYKDSKISYENKITFHQSESDIERCKQKHPKSVVQREEQNIPFICSKCSGFYSKFQNLFKLYQCNTCRITICSKCILRKNPQLQTTFIMRDITRELQQKIQTLDKTKKDKRQFNKQGDKMAIMAKQDKSKKSTSKKITPKSILGLFCQEKIKMKEKFDGDKKKQGIRKVKVEKLIQVFDNDYGIDKTTQGCYFVYVNFTKGQAGFKLYYFDAKYGQIENTFDSREKYDENSSFAYSDYDLLMVVDQYINLARQQTIKDKHVFLWGTRKQFQAKINQIKRLTAEGKIQKTQKYKVISIQIKDSSSQLVLDYAPDNFKKDGNMYDGQNDYDYHDNQAQQKKDFKYQSLAVLGDRLPALKSARTTIEFDDLGVETKHLDYFRTLAWRHSIKELKIKNNKIEDVSIILDNLSSLERLYFNQNWVKELKFTRPLPNLQILNGTQNEITSIQGLGNILNIRKLLLGNNKLKDFPKCKDLKYLNILNLAQNYLSNIENVLKADFPEIQQLIISGQFKENNMQDQQSEKQGQEKNSGGFFGLFGGKGQKQSEMVVQYPKLKNFQSYDNQDMFSGREIQFYSDSLEKITLGSCSIERIIFQRRQCLQNLKYLHLNGNKIKYFSFLSVNNQMRYRRIKDSSVSSEFEQDNKPISNESLIELNLSSNQIEYLPVMKFSALKKLELQSNNIRDIKQLKQSKLPELEELYLGSNSFTQMHELYFPKLRILTLENLKELHNTKIIFTGSQMPALEELSFSGTNQMDFSFNLNPQNNQLHELKSLNFYSSTLKNEDKMNTEFNIPSLEFLELNYVVMKYFPILNLPKVKNLCLNTLRAQSFKNLQSSKLPELTSLKLDSSEEKNIIPPKSEPNSTNPNEDKKKTPQNANINKCLTCAFNFPKLKDLSIISCKIGSLKGLEDQVFPSLDSIELNDTATLDGKVPKIRAPNATYVKCWYLKLVDCDILFGKDLTKIRKLELQNNQIESISDQTLATLTELTSLSLGNNKIKKFACSKNLDKLNLLNLNFNQLTSFPKIKARKLSTIMWEGNVFTDLSELQNCELPVLESIDLQYCDFSKSGLPRLNLPGLQSLHITSCKLVNIAKLANSDLPSLRSLDFSYNEIATFPTIHFPQLDELVLFGNKLTDLKFLKLSTLQGLNTLRLSQNPFQQIPSHQYAHLKIFECNFVQIGSVPSLQLPQIQQFTMQHAHISDMSQFAQNEYKFLKTLNLSNNQIKHLPKLYVESLTDIIMNNNQLQDVSDFFDSDVPLNDLAYVSFDNNKLTTLPNIMFLNIEVLDLANNPLTEFRALTLAEYPKITSLYLYHTQLEKITLPRLPVLEEIVFSDSKISDLNWLVTVAPSLPSLKNIQAQNCKITRVPSLQQFINLQSLYLSGNPIKNVDSFISTTENKKLKYVYIDLDVGGDFQKLKTKITTKIGMAIVGNYQNYAKNNAVQE